MSDFNAVMRSVLINGVACVVVLILTLYALGYHIVWPPTPDQLYGCTIEQQAPIGECQ
jgi:hypothetical protein